MAETLKAIPPYEPKMQNRFVVKFGEPFSIPEWVITGAERPVFRGGGWGTIVFTMQDLIGPSTAKVLMEGLEKLKPDVHNRTTVTLQLLDPIHNVVEEWFLKGGIELVDFGALDHSNEQAVIIRVHFKVYDAQLKF